MVTSSRTSVSTYTRTHTATHLADVILGSIADILATLGIDPTRLFADWPTDQSAISAWIAEGSLKCVALECHRPDGTVNPIFEFPVSYTVSGVGDRQFTADRAALARYLAKLQSVPYGTAYRLFCNFNRPHYGAARLVVGYEGVGGRNAVEQLWYARRRAARGRWHCATSGSRGELR